MIDRLLRAQLVRDLAFCPESPAMSPIAAERAVDRLSRFFALIADHPGEDLAPSRDIDTAWHAFLLRPVAYANFCSRWFGVTIDHDPGFGHGPGEAEVLRRTFDRTAELWLAKFGDSYTAGVPAGDAVAVACVRACRVACKRHGNMVACHRHGNRVDCRLRN